MSNSTWATALPDAPQQTDPLTPEEQEVLEKVLTTHRHKVFADSDCAIGLMFRAVFNAGKQFGTPVDNRPGIADKVKPDLMNIPVRDW